MMKDNYDLIHSAKFIWEELRKFVVFIFYLFMISKSKLITRREQNKKLFTMAKYEQ